MSNELMRRQLEDSLDLTNLNDVMKAEEVVMLLIDTSGSMSSYVDHINGKRAIDALREVVAEIKQVGHVPMIAFGGPYDCQVRFVDNVPEPDGGTPLHAAIPMAKTYGANRLVVISDGGPDLPGECMSEARTFGGKIDVVFVGPAGSSGEQFLRDMAAATGGTCGLGDLKNVKLLSKGIIGLLAGEVEEKAPIQGENFTTVEPDEPEDDDDDMDDDEEDDDDDDDDDNA